MALLFTLVESGSDLILSVDGSINTSTFFNTGISTFSCLIVPQGGGSLIGVGPSLTTPGSTVYVWQDNSMTGPTSIGSIATSEFADSFDVTSDWVAFNFNQRRLYLPIAYNSGDPLSGEVTFTGVSLSTFGITPGTFNWSTAGGTDTIQLIASTAPIVSSSPTPTPTTTPTNTPTNTTTPTPSPTRTASVTSTPTPTPTNTGTAGATPTPTGTAAVTPTPTQTQTGTAAVTPTPTGTAAVTPTPTPTSSPIYPLSGIGVDNQYAYTLGILGGFSGGTAPQGGYAPHPIYTDGDGVPYAQLNAITLGGFNGLNN